jgi:alkanesulfonate monooxygenase SsuD/methylene tetrahydromethanopterin reductase-like flavin-dependent oxidoreductase (luciferase family)
MHRFVGGCCVKIEVLNTASCRIDGDPREGLGNFVSIAEEAERVGYWSMWTTEDHFGSDPRYHHFGTEESVYPPTPPPAAGAARREKNSVQGASRLSFTPIHPFSRSHNQRGTS